MKRLSKLFKKHPSYCKCGNARLAKLCDVNEKEVENFKKTTKFKKLKQEYLTTIS